MEIFDARRARHTGGAVALIAATVIGVTACGATRVATPGGKPVHVQEARVGVTLRTDRRNTVTVTAYRSAVDGHPSHGVHFEAADLSICALVSGGVVGPSMTTLRTIANKLVLASAATSIAPSLKSQQLRRDHCAHGWVTFEVPDSTTGGRVVVSDDNDDSMRWAVH